jgi:hypothetical protein
MLLATADSASALSITRLVSRAADARLNLEAAQSQAMLAQATETGVMVERAIFEAWKKWYVEALDSVLKLPVSGADDGVRRSVDQETARIRARTLLLR